MPNKDGSPSAEELRTHQNNVKEMLEDVINHGDTLTITNHGKPAAVILPYADYCQLSCMSELGKEQLK